MIASHPGGEWIITTPSYAQLPAELLTRIANLHILVRSDQWDQPCLSRGGVGVGE
jgi:hypothetical protein